MGLVSSIQFYFKVGIRPSQAFRICRELSNRFYTDQQPGKIGEEIKIVTIHRDLMIEIDGLSFFVNRKTLRVTLGMYNDVPMWEAPAVASLFRYFQENGITIPRNDSGVTYYAMPGEEIHGNA
jgi:hypothetical protein